MTQFFFHIPKTGGTSFKRVLEHWFVTARDIDFGPGELRRLAEKRPTDLCIHGHFGGCLRSREDSLLARYPWIINNPDAHVFTLLRDPVEQAISYYYHELASGRSHENLQEFLLYRSEFAFRDVFEIRKSEEIDATIESFSFIGVTDELQACADRLAEMFDKPKVDVPLERVGVRDKRIGDITPAERREIELTYDLECEIYARARDALLGGEPIIWTPQTQFEHARDSRVSSRSGRILDFYAHDGDGAAAQQFKCNDAVGLTLVFEVVEGDGSIEPALRMMRGGETAFTVAYIPAQGQPSRFSDGLHKATAWIPANLLNPGLFEIEASLAIPFPVRHFASTIAPLKIEITEASSTSKTARGRWRTPFPGAVRPRLEWTAE